MEKANLYRAKAREARALAAAAASAESREALERIAVLYERLAGHRVAHLETSEPTN